MACQAKTEEGKSVFRSGSEEKTKAIKASTTHISKGQPEKAHRFQSQGMRHGKKKVRVTDRRKENRSSGRTDGKRSRVT